MNLFTAITVLKNSKALSQALVRNGVVSATIFNEHAIYSNVMKAVSYGQGKTIAVKETAELYDVHESYVWRILKKFNES